MGTLHERNPSLWVHGGEDAPTFGADVAGRRFDAVVVGGGIAGLTTARLLAADGLSVAVLEAGPLAAGATGYTTAKVTALQRTTLSELARRHGGDVAAQYAGAQRAAVERLVRLVADDGIDCELERAPACTYATTAEGALEVEAEHGAATDAGLPTRLGTTAPELPFEVTAAVWLDAQAQFHPRRYCLGLAAAVVAAGGAVAEHARAVDVDEAGDGCTVTLAGGATVTGDHVVLATHLPFPLAGLYFAKAHPYRSYAMAVRLAGPRPAGMYINVETPSRSIRSTAEGWTLLGGEGHKTGHEPDTTARYRALEEWAGSTFELTEVGARWSAQDYEAVDGLPLIGRLSRGHHRTWVATGFRKWGMTNGTLAGMVLADAVAGRANAWAAVVDSLRRPPRSSLRTLVQENADAAKRFVGDRLTGDGPTCTHLGCRLTENTAEGTWDCPCHGSRFGAGGEVLQGPAVAELAGSGD